MLIIATSLTAQELSGREDRLALIQEYKMMFSKIGEKRIGAAPENIEAVRSPFIRLKQEQAKKRVVTKDGAKVAVKSGYRLQAIVNKRAMINGHWYKEGEKIDDFKVTDIEESGLFLQNNEYKKRLMLRMSNEKISIK